MLEREVKPLDTLSILNAIPGCQLVVLPDAPQFTIVGVTDAYLATTYLKRNEVMGRGLFEVNPDNPGNPDTNGLVNLKASLLQVLEHKAEHRMVSQRYDVLNPETRQYELRVWSPLNKPVLDAGGGVQYIIHSVEDVTEKVRLQQLEQSSHQKLVESEKNLRNTVLQAPIAMSILKGPDFVVEIANDKMFGLWGKSAEDLLGKPIFEGLPEVKNQGFEQLLKGVYTTGETVSLKELPAVLPRDGQLETVYINFVYEPFREGDGAISGIIVVAIDVNEQVLARKKVEESEAQTRMAIASAHLGTYAIDVNKSTIAASPRTAEIFGLDPAQQVPYAAYTNAVHPDDVPVRNKAHKEARSTGELFYETRIVLPAGDTRWIRLNGTLIKENNTPMLIGTVLDISEEKRAAELLELNIEERTKELKAANEQLKQFTYAASHDLQEPLRKISFFIERLITSMGSDLSEEQQRYTERIQHTTKRMRTLIDDLLSYSNTSLGTTGFTTVQIGAIVKEVVDDMEAAIIKQGAEINIGDLPEVAGDERQLRQLFHNLISNALKYHKPGEAPQVQIAYVLVKGGDVAQNLPGEVKDAAFHQVTIKDNGIGFPQEDAKRIFNLFQRLHGRSEYEGTGVGLAIVEKVVENHKGFIWADSQPGSGATFTVLLPVE